MQMIPFQDLSPGMTFKMMRSNKVSDGHISISVVVCTGATCLFSFSEKIGEQDSMVLNVRDWLNMNYNGSITMFIQDQKLIPVIPVDEPSFFIPEIIPHHADDMACYIYDIICASVEREKETGNRADAEYTYLEMADMIHLCDEHDRSCLWPVGLEGVE